MAGLDDRYSTQKRRSGEYDPRIITELHRTSDVDNDQLSQHHTLGPSHNQASPGDHDHDGTNSRLLMEGITITGSKGGNVALANLISALSTALGFTNSTT